MDDVELADVGLLVLRLALGWVMVMHGIPKFKNWRGASQRWKQDWGFPYPAALVASTSELVGGVAVAIGLATQIFAAVIFFEFVVATYVCIFKYHEGFRTTSQGKGIDVNIMILAAAACLAMTGAGQIALWPGSDFIG